jgi:hypothetical protein
MTQHLTDVKVLIHILLFILIPGIYILIFVNCYPIYSKQRFMIGMHITALSIVGRIKYFCNYQFHNRNIATLPHHYWNNVL